MDIFVTTENVMLLLFLCHFSLPCLFTLNLFGLAAHCFVFALFFPSFLSFPTLCPLSLFFFLSLSLSLSRLFFTLLLLLFFESISLGLPLLSFLAPTLLLPPCRVWAQETSGLSPAVGCGRHGEDA